MGEEKNPNKQIDWKFTQMSKWRRKLRNIFYFGFLNSPIISLSQLAYVVQILDLRRQKMR